MPSPHTEDLSPAAAHPVAHHKDASQCPLSNKHTRSGHPNCPGRYFF
ncbi:hypothetical protein ACH437_15090 [Streptomyces xinghaiensis]